MTLIKRAHQSQVLSWKEDIGSGDITASLIPDDQEITATIIAASTLFYAVKHGE